jgi:Cu/Ag efflux pump CusA
MLDYVIRLSLRYRSLVLIASLVVLVYGSYLASTMSIDVFPDLDRPRVVIITEAPGLATEEVETLVTQPLEIALMGANGVQAVRSQTTAGLNVLYVEFEWSTEIRAARQTVSERLSTLEGILPSGISPQMTPPSSIMGQIVVAGIYRQAGPARRCTCAGWTANESNGGTDCFYRSTNHKYYGKLSIDEIQSLGNLFFLNWSSPCKCLAKEDLTICTRPSNSTRRSSRSPDSNPKRRHLMDLRTISDWVIRPRLLKVSGVAEVFMQGGDRKQYQVMLDPTALLEYDVTVQDVEQALSESNINTSGGFAITGESERPIRILGRLRNGTWQCHRRFAQNPSC